MALILADGFDIYNDVADAIVSNWMRETTSQTFSTTNGRFGGGCLQSTGTAGGWHIPLNVTPGSTVFICFAYKPDLTGSSATSTLLTGQDLSTSGTQLFRLEHNASGDLKAFNQPNTQVGSTAAAALTDDAWHWIEVKVVLGTGAADGSIEVRVNTISVITAATIDTNTGNNLATVMFRGSNTAARFDDVIVMDSSGAHMNNFLGDTKIDALVPNGDGSSTQWTASAGSDYQCVDDGLGVSDGDTTYIESSTNTHVNTFGMSNLSDNPTGISCVQIRTKSRKTDAGSRTYKASIVAGVTTEDGATVGATASYAWRRHGPHYVNPNGSAAWTRSAVNALQTRVELLS